MKRATRTIGAVLGSAGLFGLLGVSSPATIGPRVSDAPASATIGPRVSDVSTTAEQTPFVWY